jgi:hypothetical protein
MGKLVQMQSMMRPGVIAHSSLSTFSPEQPSRCHHPHQEDLMNKLSV